MIAQQQKLYQHIIKHFTKCGMLKSPGLPIAEVTPFTMPRYIASRGKNIKYREIPKKETSS